MAKDKPKRRPLVGTQLELMQIVWERGKSPSAKCWKSFPPGERS